MTLAAVLVFALVGKILLLALIGAIAVVAGLVWLVAKIL